MPEPQNSFQSSGTFPLPNALVDEWLPRLKDTELRLLLVVLRQTVGRRDAKTGLPKDRDWLTQSQLKRRTGRASEALAAAIDALVKQRLLSVEAEDGTPLALPEQRRRHHARLYYRPHPRLVEQRRREIEYAKANTTKNNGYGNKEFRRVRKADSVPVKAEALTAEQKKSIDDCRRRIRQRLSSLP